LLGVLVAQGAVQVAAAEAPSPPSTSSEPSPMLLLTPGQMQTVDVANVQRVVVGNPDVIDVTIISSSKILVQPKKVGATNLLVWDAKGQRELRVSVVDPTPGLVAQQLPKILADLGLSGIEVKTGGGKVFLIGGVDTDAQLGTLEQMSSTYQGTVVNLVTVKPATGASQAPESMIKLSVQVVEINRKDLEKLGFNWSTSVSFTEPEATDRTVRDALMRFGTSVTRGSFGATLNALVQKNLARILSEPNLVTASGKEASSFIGVEVPVINATSVGTGGGASVNASIQFRQTGVLLKMTPHVDPADTERNITITMEAEVSGVDKSVGLSVPVGSQTILVPGFKVRRANTEVTTTSGETVVIAGLLEAEDTKDVTQVPGLGGMPVVGRLFRSPEVQSTQRELVIAITPEILGDEAKETDRRVALEQALAVAEVTASVDDPRLRYALQIQDRIAKALRYPGREKELNIEGTVKLKLHLFADGTLGRAMVSESSGVESLDLEALKAAESQTPYPGFPSQLTERELWLEVPIIFRP